MGQYPSAAAGKLPGQDSRHRRQRLHRPALGQAAGGRRPQRRLPGAEIVVRRVVAGPWGPPDFRRHRRLESLRAAVAGRQIVYQLAGCLRRCGGRNYCGSTKGGCEWRLGPGIANSSNRPCSSPPPRWRPPAEPTRPAPPRNRPLLAGLGLRAEQAGRRTGGAYVGRPRSHHHRAAADRFRRRRSRHAPRLSADLANRRPHGSRLGTPPFFPDPRRRPGGTSRLGRRAGPPPPARRSQGGGRPGAGRPGDLLRRVPESPTYGELGRMIAAALGRRRVLVIPTAGPVVWAVAGAAEAFHRLFFGRPAYFNLDKAREATAGSWVCSPQAAADELGSPSRFRSRSASSRDVEGYRAAGWM